MAAPFDDTNPVRKTYFINESERDAVTPANDAGKVPQLENDGRLTPNFLPANNPYSVAKALLVDDTDHTDLPSTTSDETLYSVTIPANKLNGNAVRFRISLDKLRKADGNPASIKLKYGSTTVCTLNTSSPIFSNTVKGEITGVLIGTGVSAQEGELKVHAKEEGAGTALAEYFKIVYGTSAEDSTGDLTLSIEVSASVAPANFDISTNFCLVELLEV